MCHWCANPSPAPSSLITPREVQPDDFAKLPAAYIDALRRGEKVLKWQPRVPCVAVNDVNRLFALSHVPVRVMLAVHRPRNRPCGLIRSPPPIQPRPEFVRDWQSGIALTLALALTNLSRIGMPAAVIRSSIGLKPVCRTLMNTPALLRQNVPPGFVLAQPLKPTPDATTCAPSIPAPWSSTTTPQTSACDCCPGIREPNAPSNVRTPRSRMNARIASMLTPRTSRYLGIPEKCRRLIGQIPLLR